MRATRAGAGCGACKGLVSDLVGWYCGGAMEEDPAANYYVPSIALTRSQLNQVVREKNLRSVSSAWAPNWK